VKYVTRGLNLGHLCRDATQNGLQSHTVLSVEMKGDGFPNANYQHGLKIKEKKTHAVGLTIWP